jgi:hypothetical protein
MTQAAVESLNIITALETHCDAAVERLRPLYRMMDFPEEMPFSDWLMLYSLTLQHGPRRVVEIGRGFGSSTCVFAEAAHALGASFVSYDLEHGQWAATLPKVVRMMGKGWLPREGLAGVDFMLVHPKQVVPGGERTLLFLAPHDRDHASHIVTHIFPRLGPEDLIIVRNVTDFGSGLIEAVPVQWCFESYCSPFESLAVLHEYWQGHNTPVRSPARDAAPMMTVPSDTWARFSVRLPLEARPLIGRGGHWVYFCLDSAKGTR